MKGDTMTAHRNEAAREVARLIRAVSADPAYIQLLDEALATERRLTVERVREALEKFGIGGSGPFVYAIEENDLDRILDDISKEGTP